MIQHVLITNAIRKAHKADPHPAATIIEPMDDREMCRLLFANYRGPTSGDAKGLRLTQGGLAIMSVFFKAYEVKFLDPLLITGRHLLYLDRICKMPWHIDIDVLTLFDPDMAMKAKLAGDIDALIQCFSS
jgi:hypothetical protein